MVSVKPVEDTRHDNLLAILAELGREHGAHGALQVLATAMDKAHSQLSQLKTRAKHSKTGKPRNIGTKMAREIEKAAEIAAMQTLSVRPDAGPAAPWSRGLRKCLKKR